MDVYRFIIFGNLRVGFLKRFHDGNVSGANQPLRATVQTSNLGHMMLIQGAHVDWAILRLTARS
jgi:hypothetical protein